MSRWKPGPESEDFKEFWEEWVTYPSRRQVEDLDPDHGPAYDHEHERQMREQYYTDCRAMHAEAIEAYLEAGGILLPGWTKRWGLDT